MNAALAGAIREATTSGTIGRPSVFTGDLANEFLADYVPEAAGGVVQYSLPALAPATSVARSFRASIPATARLACSEPGTLVTVQPYAAAAISTYPSRPPFSG